MFVPTLDEIQAMTVQLMPEVASIAGRAFDQAPIVVIDDKERLLMSVQARRTPQTTLAEGLLIDRRVEIIRRAWAIYSSYDGKIHILMDNYRSYINDTGVNPDVLFKPALRCVLAHEMTHYLQDEYVELPKVLDAEQGLMQDVLLEGQAEWVMQQSCKEPLIWNFITTSLGYDVLSSRDPSDPVVLKYGYGKQFMEALWLVGGMEATWHALELLPPSREELLDVVRPRLLPGWLDDSFLRSAAAPLVVAGAKVSVRPANAWSTFLPSEGREKDSLIAPASRAGLSLTAIGSGLKSKVVALVMEQLDGPRTWIQTRRAIAKSFAGRDSHIMLFFLSYGIDDVGVRRLAALERHYNLDDTLCLRVFASVGYQECWAAKGRLLLLTVESQSRVRGGNHDKIMASILDRHLSTEYVQMPAAIPKAIQMRLVDTSSNF